MIIIDYDQQCNISLSPPYNSPKETFDTTSGFRELALLPLIWGIVSILCVCVCVCVCLGEGEGWEHISIERYASVCLKTVRIRTKSKAQNVSENFHVL